MVTDKSRREVAHYLRSLDDSKKGEIKARMDRLSNKELGAALLSALGLFVALGSAGFDTETGGDLFELLACLIDRPACRAVQTAPGAFYECSECGYDEWYTSASVDNYCPRCGCEVIGDVR